MKARLFLMLFLLVAHACDNGGTVVSKPGGTADAAVAEVAADVPVEGEDLPTQPDIALDEGDEPDGWTFEAGPDLPFVECEPGTGCFLDPCVENGDCQSSYCVEHMGAAVCTQPCQDECPQGWSCQQVAGTEPDVVYICVSDHANLCKPCGAAADCKSVGGVDDVCVLYGEEGSFCGGGCASDEDCPWGFSCAEAVTVSGVSTKQCVADAGVCPCTPKSVELALATPCKVTNEFGTCSGQRVCTAAGLSECDAAAPSHEECNGIDDNCDGDVDEPGYVDGEFLSLCDDGNDCTEDLCLGDEGCQHDLLDQGECKDGDPCTVGDHCEAGVCIGQLINCDDNNPCTTDSCDPTGGCAHGYSSEKCDDGDPCTVADQCAEGQCQGVAVACDCQKDADCQALEDGDLCNGTLFCDLEKLPYQCKVDPATVVSCPEPPAGPDAICLEASCNPATGACSLLPDHEGYACNDGDACTVGDVCGAGECKAGVGALCNDNNPCTDDSCDPATGCVHTPNAAPCNDGNPCTTGDQCAGGQCAGTGQLDCNDGNVCTDDSCNPQSGCVHAGNAAPCDDGKVCTVNDQCQGGVCVAGAPLDCDDDNVCTADSCGALGCKHTPVSGACDDGNPCTLNDKCSAGKCVSGAAVDCDDGNPCTLDTCSDTGLCTHAPVDGECDDGNACTVGDHCEVGQCVHAGLDKCDDDNVCTTDSCDPLKGCVHLVNSVPCNDGNLCTTDDHCHLGECIGGGALTCDDSNPCTDDSCLPKAGCHFVPNTDPCDDGSACSLDDQCKNGWCLPGTALECDDDNLCTDDGCDPESGCVHVDNALPCDDGSACTTGDKCAQGSCLGGPAPDCNDANPCTDDSCNPLTGCVHVNNVAACEDGNACTLGDTCVDGACVAGTGKPDCNDENLCTDDACVPAFGCIHINNSVPCDDGNECTDPDTCSGGECASGPAVVCPDDGNTCTVESCDEEQGCVTETLADCCGNGIVEGAEKCDDGNQQDGDGCDADCTSAGVWAFDEFRPAMKCGDFVALGPSYMKFCFTLKGKSFCTGQHDQGNVQCFDEANGIRFLYDWGATWPMRFTPATQECMNYHPSYLVNFAHAIGYANYQVLQQKTGNSCERTWLDANGAFQQTGGDSGSNLPYEIKYWN